MSCQQGDEMDETHRGPFFSQGGVSLCVDCAGLDRDDFEPPPPPTWDRDPQGVL